MPNVRLKPFAKEQSDELASISKAAFEDDVHYGAPAVGGPPGYDSPEWQIDMVEKGATYFLIEADGVLVGGLMAYPEPDGQAWWLGRIFIDPRHQNQGIGTEVLRILQSEAIPAARRWKLETPKWNLRTHHFYEKNGFVMATSPQPDQVLYVKQTNKPGD